ncbi:MAG: hypothetical protein EXR75_17310 [Myxococcales bacterium]|nr:hypothetical protein [Myxococcales bacterium]
MTTADADVAANSLRALLESRASRETLRAFLTGLGPSERVRAALDISGALVGKLYEACAGGPALTLEDFVPAALGENKPVIFEGRNSLPLFTRFQKRFCRMGAQIVGYNHQTMSIVTGPGFFVVAAASPSADVPGELYFDYTMTPGAVPSGWPAFKPNDAGLSNLVYKNMKDYMREVAPGVVVGTAYKLGKAQKAYFVLARSE